MASTPYPSGSTCNSTNVIINGVSKCQLRMIKLKGNFPQLITNRSTSCQSNYYQQSEQQIKKNRDLKIKD